jgi:methylglutaconyl-CoA hydratase
VEFSRLTYEAGDRRAIITLNRPDKRNALDDVMVKELTGAFQMAGSDRNAKVVLLTASGTSFCAGADLEYLKRLARFDLDQNRVDSNVLAKLFREIYELRKPVIAVVNGPALAGGCGLATVCDFVFASEENARFGYPEVRIGFVPAVVLLFLVKRVGEGRAREMILRGNTISAIEAKEIGLVTMVAAEAELGQRVDAFVDELIHNNSAQAMGSCKELLSKGLDMSLGQYLDFAAEMNALARTTADWKRGVQSFLNKEKLDW